MQPTWVIFALVIGCAGGMGCHGFGAPRGAADGPAACGSECGPPGQPRVESQHDGGVVVHVPRSKVVVDSPATGAAAQDTTGGTAQGMGYAAAMAAPGAFPQAMMPGFPQAMAVPGGLSTGLFPVGGSAQNQIVSGRVRQRTGLGFAFDTIKISIPIIRPIPVERPTEVSFEVQGTGRAAPPGLGAFGFTSGVSQAGGVPVGVPFAVGGGFPAVAAGGMPFGAVGPPVVAGFGMAVPNGMMVGGTPQGLTPQQLAILQAAAQAQAQANAAGAGTASALSAGGVSDAQLEELIQKCEELKRLKQLREQQKSAGSAPGGKDKK